MNEADMHCYLWPTSSIILLVRGTDGLYDAATNVQMPLSVPSSGQKAEQEPQPAARAAALMPLAWLAPGAGNLQHVPPSPTQPPRQPAITRPPPRPLNGGPCHEKALFSGRCTAQWLSTDARILHRTCPALCLGVCTRAALKHAVAEEDLTVYSCVQTLLEADGTLSLPVRLSSWVRCQSLQWSSPISQRP